MLFWRFHFSVETACGLLGRALCDIHCCLKACLLQESNVAIIQKIIKLSPGEHYENIVRLLLFIVRHVTAGSFCKYSRLLVSSRELYRTRKCLPFAK